MGRSDLPDMYAQSLKAAGPRAYISSKSQVSMLQLICNTFLVSCAQAKSSVKLQQLYLSCNLYVSIASSNMMFSVCFDCHNQMFYP